MSLYIKVDRFFGTNAKMANVGLVGLAVLLQLDAEHLSDPNEGVVSGLRASPKQLRLRLAAFGISEKQVAKALADLQTEGIIELLEDGAVRMLNWKEWSDRPMTDAERKRAERARKRAERDASVTVSRDVTNGHDASVTPSRTERDASGLSRPRAEQPRAEQSRANARVRAHEGAPPPTTPDGSSLTLGLADCETQDPPLGASDRAVGILTVLEQAHFDRGRSRWRWANELAIKGMEPGDALALWKLAQARGHESSKLFAHWLREGLWRSVLDEERARAKERDAKQRGREARAEVEP